MNPIRHIVLPALGAALALGGAGAHAQSLFSYRLQPYLGASVGAGIYPDQTGNTAGSLQGAYTSSTSLQPGDYVVSYGRQDQSDFAGKLYGGAWITPNFGIEGGYAWLGRIGWSAYSTNTTGSLSYYNSGVVRPDTWYEAAMLGTDWMGVRYYLKGGLYEASTSLQGSNFNTNTGSSAYASQSLHNTGGLVGVGVHAGSGNLGFRLEVEDFLDVGDSTPSTVVLPPWKANVILLSAGVTMMF